MLGMMCVRLRLHANQMGDGSRLSGRNSREHIGPMHPSMHKRICEEYQRDPAKLIAIA
jgi:hypothetical protein